jgi:hypothetical protein
MAIVITAETLGVFPTESSKDILCNCYIQINYSMEINLWDLPEDKTYVKLREIFHSKLFELAVKKAGSQENLAKTLAESGREFSKDIKINQQYISGMVNNYHKIRLDIVLFITDLLSIPKEEVQRNISIIKGVGTSKCIIEPKLPFKLDESLATIVSKLNCDGSVSESNSFTATYVNKNKKLIEDFKNKIKRSFGDMEIAVNTANGISVARVTGFLGLIITVFFGHTKATMVPNQIMNSCLEVKKAFIRNVFDDEGSVHKTHGQIRLKMLNKPFVEGVKYILEKDFGIKCSDIFEDRSSRYSNNTHYYFLISNRFNLKKFKNEIGFCHPDKMRKLNVRLSNVKKMEYPKHAANRLIYDILKFSPMTSGEVSFILNRSKRIVHSHLNELKRNNLVCCEYIKRKNYYEFLWKAKK